MPQKQVWVLFAMKTTAGAFRDKSGPPLTPMQHSKWALAE